MFAQIIGYLLISIGVLFFVKPDVLKKRLIRKNKIKTLRFQMAVVSLLTFIVLFATSFTASKVISHLFLFFAILSLIKFLLLLNKRLSLIIFDYLSSQPLSFYRYSSFLFAGIGFFIIFTI